MKSLKHFLIPSILFFIGCDLYENPPFLDDTIYQDSQSIIGARDGIFQAITTYDTLIFMAWRVFTSFKEVSISNEK